MRHEKAITALAAIRRKWNEMIKPWKLKWQSLEQPSRKRNTLR